MRFLKDHTIWGLVKNKFFNSFYFSQTFFQFFPAPSLWTSCYLCWKILPLPFHIINWYPSDLSSRISSSENFSLMSLVMLKPHIKALITGYYLYIIATVTSTVLYFLMQSINVCLSDYSLKFMRQHLVFNTKSPALSTVPRTKQILKN